jgi:hypothetical protein
MMTFDCIGFLRAKKLAGSPSNGEGRHGAGLLKCGKSPCFQSLIGTVSISIKRRNQMTDINVAMIVVTALSAPFDIPDPVQKNWCTPGYTVMLPEGREGVVTSTVGDICRVVADGEAYATLIPHFILEPVYPQAFPLRPHR